jgi:hypothetical protein
VLLFAPLFPAVAAAQPWAELEIGPSWQGRNDVRIPGDSGTRFSLTDDLEPEVRLYGRAHLGWDIDRHRVFLTAAPVRASSEGSFDRPVRFRDHTFAPGGTVKGDYKFNTYRATYRYLVVQHSAVDVGLGATLLLRDAHIRLDDGSVSRTKKNLGAVPLVRLELRVKMLEWLHLGLDADGLWSRRGRAFDVLSALHFPAWEHVSPYLGYRFIEGGSDVDEVYNFALLHFGAAGLRVSL